MSIPSLAVQVQGQSAVTADYLNTLLENCQTAAQLRTFSGVTGMGLFLQGIAAPNDGLGGYFAWTLGSATDDNLYTIVPSGQTAGYWKRLGQWIIGAGAGGGSSANAAIEFRYDGGGSVPSTGVLGDQVLPFPCTISNWTLQCDQTGSMSLDIWAAPFVQDSPPTSTNSITGSATPGFVSHQQVQSSTLTGWTTVLPGNTCLRYNLISISTITRFTLTLAIVKNPT